MKSVKWFYVGAMAIALGMLTFATVACHDDDDDPKPAEGEVIETPKPVVEYYIMGTVTSGGKAMNGVKVKWVVKITQPTRMVSSLLQKVLQVLIVLKRLLMDIFHRKRQLSLQIMRRIVVW